VRRRLPLLVPLVAAGLIVPVTAAHRLRRSLGASTVAVDAVRTAPWREGRFANRLPMTIVEQTGSIAIDMARRDGSGRPTRPVPLVRPDLPAQAAELAVTWLGHATTLLEIGGHWVLTDPVWSERCSPSATVGPRRTHPVPLAIADLPRLAAIVISHDHYDHLDTATVDALTASQDAPWVVPLGVGSHLRRWGVPAHRIVELDWDGTHTLEDAAGELSLTCTEARHFSGRALTNNRTLWASWVLTAGKNRVYFGGDTGYTEELGAIGHRHGPFDLSLLPIGAYDARWPDVHLDPEQAVRVHQEMGGSGVLAPIHWATFDLAFHAWAEPAERLLEAARSAGVDMAVPRPGERFEPRAERPVDPWWRIAR
jgi:L-ascorbate metabolism protein UlaG (beta-lactamase superfamily)